MKKLAKLIRDTALAYPETREDHPWGESAFKVKEKAFIFMNEGDELSFSLKLPHSRDFALSFPGSQPTGYGLGRSSWVTVKPPNEKAIPPDVLRAWIDESFRAVAPKRLAATVTTR